jgi:D-sedoheptulose 7-phosphate isomerase
MDSIKKSLEASKATLEKVIEDHTLLKTLQEASEVCISRLNSGNKIMFAGNGGSAADSQHLAGELVSRFNYERDALYGIALTNDSSIMTSIGNDYGFEEVFARQIKGLGQAGDIFVALSTSGNSPNIIQAINAAKAKKIMVIGLTGESGGKMSDICDFIFKIPSSNTPRIQEMHIKLGHILCELIEDGIFAKGKKMQDAK